MRAHCRCLSLLGLTLAASVHAQTPAAPVRLDVRPSFVGMAVQGHTYPVVVTLQNVGPSAEGVLTIQPSSFMQADLGGGDRTYLYRVPLPSGTVKRVIAYPTLRPDRSEIVVTFAGNFRGRRIEERLPIESLESQQIGYIGDQTGALGVLRKQRFVHPQQLGMQSNGPVLRVCDARPEDAPDRMVGYAALNTLVIGEGAERMLPAQWAAIRRWVMAGGRLLLSGGPGAVYLNVPDVQPLLPVQHVSGAVAGSLRLPGVPALPGPVGLMTGALKPGAISVLSQDGRNLVARQAFGAGTVLFTAFSTVEPPFRGWEFQVMGWMRLLERQPDGRSGPLWALAMQNRENYPPGVSIPPAQFREDPFRIELPPTGTIVLMFLAYFVLVVPVSYLVLRKAKRLEWAWVTGPLLSIGFAWGFNLFAGELTKTVLSRRTTGLLVAAAGEKEAMFIGSTEMFFPHGGDYALEIPNAETLESQVIGERYYGGYSGRRQNTEKLETIDVGAVIAPKYSVTNLAFRRVFHAEPAAWDGLTGTAQIDARGKLTGRVTNGSKYALNNAALILLGTGVAVNVGTIRPGQTVDLGGKSADLPEPVAVPGPAMPSGGPSVPSGAPMPGAPPMPGGPMPGGPPAVRRGSRGRPAPPRVPVVYNVQGAELSQRSQAAAILMRDQVPGMQRPSGAVLFAETSGAPFGPQFGKAVESGENIDVLISLPLVGGGS